MLLGISPNSSMSFYTTVPCAEVLSEVSGSLEHSSGLHPFDLTQLHGRAGDLTPAGSACILSGAYSGSMLGQGDQGKEKKNLCVTGKCKDNELTVSCCLPYPKEARSYPGQK